MGIFTCEPVEPKSDLSRLLNEFFNPDTETFLPVENGAKNQLVTAVNTVEMTKNGTETAKNVAENVAETPGIGAEAAKIELATGNQIAKSVESKPKTSKKFKRSQKSQGKSSSSASKSSKKEDYGRF